MLRTDSKSPIAKGLSYPLGTQQISAALEGLDQYDEIEIVFQNNVDRSPVRLRELVKSGAPIRILSADHSITFGSVFQKRKVERDPDTWGISVFALPSEYKKDVRRILLDSGLPKVREWLSRERKQAEESPYEKIILDMIFPTGELTVRNSDYLFG